MNEQKHEFWLGEDKLRALPSGASLWVVALSRNVWGLRKLTITGCGPPYEGPSWGVDKYHVYFHKVKEWDDRTEFWLSSKTGDIPFGGGRLGHFFTNYFHAWAYLNKIQKGEATEAA